MLLAQERKEIQEISEMLSLAANLLVSLYVYLSLIFVLLFEQLIHYANSGTIQMFFTEFIYLFEGDEAR